MRKQGTTNNTLEKEKGYNVAGKIREINMSWVKMRRNG